MQELVQRCLRDPKICQKSHNESRAKHSIDHYQNGKRAACNRHCHIEIRVKWSTDRKIGENAHVGHARDGPQNQDSQNKHGKHCLVGREYELKNGGFHVQV